MPNLVPYGPENSADEVAAVILSQWGSWLTAVAEKILKPRGLSGEVESLVNQAIARTVRRITVDGEQIKYPGGYTQKTLVHLCQKLITKYKRQRESEKIWLE